jgi:hypothetical protein
MNIKLETDKVYFLKSHECLFTFIEWLEILKEFDVYLSYLPDQFSSIPFNGNLIVCPKGKFI